MAPARAMTAPRVSTNARHLASLLAGQGRVDETIVILPTLVDAATGTLPGSRRTPAEAVSSNDIAIRRL
ncbi:hypothetical protein [Micromonospora sp. DT47]|uniref:hypothetical protein n=1 Tax=Micromonospora sp. DT47 TaxID=3393431 RepID=UPI003CF3841C